MATRLRGLRRLVQGHRRWMLRCHTMSWSDPDLELKLQSVPQSLSMYTHFIAYSVSNSLFANTFTFSLA